MERIKNEEIEIDLIDIFYRIKSRIWLILLTGFLTASIFGATSYYLITPIYTSTAKLYILSKTTSITSLADIQLGTQLTQDYMVLVKSRPVVIQVAKNLNLNMTYEELADIISVSNPTNTRILVIRAKYPNSAIAKRIVDEFANVSKSQIAKIMDVDEPTIVENGYASGLPSSPNIVVNSIIGGIIGIIIATVMIIAFHLMNDTIKDSEDIEKYLGISTLGLIPIETGKNKQPESDRKKRKKDAKRKKGKGE